MFLSRLPALSVVVSGGGRVYVWDWGVGGGGVSIVIPGVITWLGLDLRHPPTVAAAH